MTDQASFDLLRKRLGQSASTLKSKNDLLNADRLQLFGRIEPAILARLTARTEHNCQARDVVRVGSNLLLGFNVFMGLKRETQISDVFALYRLGESQDSELLPVALDGSFLSEPRFVADFKELMTYYRQTTLDQLRVNNDRLLMIFRTGSGPLDKRVFRFSLARDGALSYIDNRGEREHVFPPSHDFEWVASTREMHVLGRHPHVNVLDTLFVETVGGDLTIKIENNSDTGLGIYSEPVSDKTQALADAEIYYADFKHLLLLKIKPYREQDFRYLVYIKRQQRIERIDEIGLSVAQLPEDHGLVFPGGYILESGESKRLSEQGHDFSNFKLKRIFKAPNGEDVLYVFYAEQAGSYALLAYNLIDRSLAPPLFGHGYARFADGRVLLFVQEGSEPTRLHTMQLWRTPFADAEHASAHKASQDNLLGKLGNAVLVRALAELRQLAQLAEDAKTLPDYERLLKLGQKCADAYPWLAQAEAHELREQVLQVSRTGQAALQAFAQIEQQKQQATASVRKAEVGVRELLSRIASLLWQKPEEFTEAIRSLKRRRGELMALAEQAFVNADQVQSLTQQLKDEQARVGERALKFFSEPLAFAGLAQQLKDAQALLAKAKSTADLKKVAHDLDELAESLEGLTELISGFEQSDPLVRAQLLERTSKLFAEVNRVRAQLRIDQERLLTQELGAEFQAQLTVFEQAQQSALARAKSTEHIDESQARLLSQLNELEAKFAQQSEFAEALLSRREGLLEAFSSRREQMRAERDVHVQSLKASVLRVLEGLPKRLHKLTDAGALHAFFASDPLLERAFHQLDGLREMGEVVLADELSGRIKSLKESSQRDLRDRLELGSGDALKLGKHRFSVASRTLELALSHEGEQLQLVLSGTDYRAPAQLPDAERFQGLAAQALVSESSTVYRAESLAFQAWRAHVGSALTLSLEERIEALAKFAAERPAEDYQRGIHEQDAARILHTIVPKLATLDGLLIPAPARVLAMAFSTTQLEHQLDDARALFAAKNLLPEDHPQKHSWPTALKQGIEALAAELELDQLMLLAGMRHAQQVLGSEGEFPVSGIALDSAERLSLDIPRAVLAQLKNSRSALKERLHTLAALAQSKFGVDANGALEAAALLLIEPKHRRLNAELKVSIDALLGQHPRVQRGVLELDLAEFHLRMSHFVDVEMPRFRAYAKAKHSLIEEARTRLRLHQFEAKPLAGFVRNRLIDEVYLPLIGNNLAKQIGTLDDKRPDRSGMLLLISPPGYGKTTLMEYLADRLGMIFVRINGPTLGHEVNSLDPAQSDGRAVQEELQKLNLGLSMGNNVMLYLDDIQHLSPEFLQKFISLSDATRRIDAIIDGAARSIDLRGKRFAIVMAGNPYTESGEAFRIPDMLANRADVYNLGDVLSGREALFDDSYIENAMSAHPLTAAISEQGREVVLSAMRIAAGGEGVLPNSVPQAADAIEVLKRMLQLRSVLSKVNAAYVASAAQDDAYRTEPPFKLQGSYRNMAKVTAQLSPLMTEVELKSLIADHYRGEAQTLGARAEENLLKLASLSDALDTKQAARWQELCDNFRRIQMQGGKGADGSTKLANLLGEIALKVERLGTQSESASDALIEQLKNQPSFKTELSSTAKALAAIHVELARLSKTAEKPAPPQHTPKLEAQIRAALETPAEFKALLERLGKSYEETLIPLVSALHHKMTLDHSIWENVRSIKTDLDSLMRRTK